MGIKLKTLLLFAFFFTQLFRTSVKAEVNAVETYYEESYIALYEFNFKTADSLIDNMVIYYPNHFLTHLSKANFFWWELISQEHNSSLLGSYYKSLDDAEKALIVKYSRHEESIVKDYYLANIYALRVRVELMNENYIQSFNYLKKYAHLISSLSEKKKQIPGIMVVMGLYNYLTDYASKKYPFLSFYAYMFPKGNMEKGLSQLKTALTLDNRLVRTDANYFLMKIFLELEENELKAKIYSANLVNLYPDNIIFLHEKLKIAKKYEDELLFDKVKSEYEKALISNKDLTSAQQTYLSSLIDNF